MSKPLQKPEISQLHRLKGQLSGIEKMIKNNTKTSEIIQQIEAIKGSLKTLEKRLLESKTKTLKDEEIKKTLDYLLKIS